MKSTRQIVEETGMSKSRALQFAKEKNLPKLGNLYMWDEQAEREFLSRIGVRGREVGYRKPKEK